MRNQKSCLLLAVFLVGVCGSAAAQLNGCVDSPENPTALLMVVGAAAFAWPSVRAKIRNGRKK